MEPGACQSDCLGLTDWDFIEFLSLAPGGSIDTAMSGFYRGSGILTQVLMQALYPRRYIPSLGSKKPRKSNENYPRVNEQGQEGTLQRWEEHQGERETWTGLNVASVTGV